MQFSQATFARDDARKEELSAKRLQLKQEIKQLQDQQRMVERGFSRSGSRPFSSSRQQSSLPPRHAFDRYAVDPMTPDGSRDRNFSPSSTSTTASGDILGDSTSNHQAIAKEANANESPTEMPHLTGVLMKRPSHSNEKGIFGNMSLRGVQERYCVLDGSGEMKYYKRKTDREPRGSIPLGDPALEVVYSKTEIKNLEFSICTPTHQNPFNAKSRDDLLKWVAALEKTHKIIMDRTNGGHKQNTVRRQESVVSNDSYDSRDRSSNLVTPSSSVRYSHDPVPRSPPGRGGNRATLGF